MCAVCVNTHRSACDSRDTHMFSIVAAYLELYLCDLTRCIAVKSALVIWWYLELQLTPSDECCFPYLGSFMSAITHSVMAIGYWSE